MYPKIHLPLDVIKKAGSTSFSERIIDILRRQRWLRYIRKMANIKLWYMSGLLKGEKQLHIIFVGSPRNMNYFSELIFENQYTQNKFGLKFFMRIILNLLTNQSRNTIFIQQTNKIPKHTIDRHKHFVIPEWIGGYIDLSMNLESHMKSNKTIKSNYKKIKNNNFSYSISKDPVLFDRFYHTMYQVYAAERYGKTALVVPYDKMKDEFNNGELLLINNQDQYVGGLLIGYNQETGIPYLSKLGVLNADFNLVKNGVISALYYFSLAYLKDRGFKSVALGGNRPFLNDGVLRYKVKNWNMKIQVHLDRVFLVKPMGFGRGIKKFLLNNPFITLYENKPCGVVFYEENDNLRSHYNHDRLIKHHKLKGLSKVILQKIAM